MIPVAEPQTAEDVLRLAREGRERVRARARVASAIVQPVKRTVIQIEAKEASEVVPVTPRDPCAVSLVSGAVTTAKRPPLRLLLNVASAAFGVPVNEMLSQRRCVALQPPRRAFVWLAKHTTYASYPTMAGYLGGRDHTTLMHAYKRALEMREEDAGFRAVTDAMIGAVLKRFPWVAPEDAE